MALTSPGVEVTVTDESFYVPADQGMVPSIIVATAKNKTSGTGSGTAAGTLTANEEIYNFKSKRINRNFWRSKILHRLKRFTS
jgi:hypothetical protein